MVLTSWERYGAECRAEGKYIALVEMVRNWYESKSRLPLEDLAGVLGLSVLVFEGIVALIKEHPDWDDEKVADEADWVQRGGA